MASFIPMTRPYRIERTLGLGPVIPAGADERLDEILATVRELKRALAPARPVPADMVEAWRREAGEVYALRAELDAMKGAITATKREMAALQRCEDQGKGMRRAAGELDAVVEATERATTAILGAVEEIEASAAMLRAAGSDLGKTDCVGAILDRVVVLYEACNFQDLTGQRITKIVGVLKFVEDRLDRMIAVWGGLDAFRALAGPESGVPSLLNGPKLADEPGHVSQTDIDALFG